MSAPAVGVCAAVETVRWAFWEETVTMAPRSYSLALQRAGAHALLLPPDDGAVDDPDPLLDRLDGLMLAGGSDVDPDSYGAVRDERTGTTWPERDAFEVSLARRAMERGIPLLGICRGMQMINVACGGTLDQHIPSAVGHEGHMETPGRFSSHQVRIDPDTTARAASGAEDLAVRSHHHQGVETLAPGLKVSARASDDELIEAIEPQDDSLGWQLGVLWHPEEDPDDPVIPAFVAEAASFAEARISQ